MGLHVKALKARLLRRWSKAEDREIEQVKSGWKIEQLKSRWTTFYIERTDWSLQTHHRETDLRQVGDVGEDVHVAEGVDGEDGEVALRLAQMVERVGKFKTVGNEEVDVGSLVQQLAGSHLCELFDDLYKKRMETPAPPSLP